jgi:soluble lytic murein transglycosylase
MSSTDPPIAPRLRRILTWAVVVLLVSLGLIDWWYERLKERRFDPIIAAVSHRFGVDPALVKGLVWRESKFNPKARGRVGEIGLMQVRLLTAQEWAQAQTSGRTFDGNLLDPATNLQIGTWYLGKLLRRYSRTDDPVAYALADYNAGRSNVLRWNKGVADTNSAAFLGQVTFPATREYIRAIKQRAERYKTAVRTAPG